MTTIDWIIVAVIIGAIAVVAVSMTRYTKSVTDFLAANRAAGRYLLTMAEGMAGLGAITLVAYFEKYYHSGFGSFFWGQMLAPLGLILALSGWVIYRYRETRALTMAQFFEMRYSRNFRIYAGILCWFSGILNYGIFPAVTSRFIVYFTGLPLHVCVLGLEIPTTAIIMFVLLSTAVIFTLAGGQIAVIVTDFLQGQLLNIVILICMVVIFVKFDWSDIVAGLQTAPENQSRINPFKQGSIPDFNPLFFFLMAFSRTYGYMAWQGAQGYNAAAKSPHEAKMAKILAGFRGMLLFFVVALLPICAYALMHNPKFAEDATVVSSTLQQIPDEQIRDSMTVPVALRQILPVGVIGLFATVIIAASISTDDTYLHSWGSIFIQDVVMPFRRKPLSQEAHMKLLRLSIVGVAIFGFVFSLLFPLKDYIYMYFEITAAIYIGGAGAAIIGGLYWKRGTTAGAWTGMTAGGVLAVTGIVLRNIMWPSVLPGLKTSYPDIAWLQNLPQDFPLNGVEMTFWVAFAGASLYVLISVISGWGKPSFNMKKMLHRGEYAIDGEHRQVSQSKGLSRVLGMGNEFTPMDKGIYIFKMVFTLTFFALFVTATVWNLAVKPFTDHQWSGVWFTYMVVYGVVGVLATIWFLFGGFCDLRDLLHTLKTAKRDQADDGWVEERTDA